MRYALSLITFSFSKPTTERALDASEILILLCGLILAMGAAGEYIEEHGTLPRWMNWSRRPKLVFVWMVALSLVGEFVGDAGVFVFSGHLQTINDGEYASLNKEAGFAWKDASDANERAGNAYKDAGEANERAGKLEAQAAALRKQAEDEHMARVGLEDKVAWRTFSERQRGDFTTNLSRFAGQLSECTFLSSDMEAFSFSSEIAAALRMAKWRVIPPDPNVMDGKATSLPTTASPLEKIDLGVELTSTSNSDAVAAARAIMEELERLGFDAHVRPSAEPRSYIGSG